MGTFAEPTLRQPVEFLSWLQQSYLSSQPLIMALSSVIPQHLYRFKQPVLLPSPSKCCTFWKQICRIFCTLFDRLFNSSEFLQLFNFEEILPHNKHVEFDNQFPRHGHHSICRSQHQTQYNQPWGYKRVSSILLGDDP